MLARSLLALAAATLPLVTAAPALNPPATLTETSPRITHTVVAGRPGLRFDPENIVAEVGSIVEFHFLQLNHSVAEAAFAAPCVPKDAASFFSGFFPVPSNPDMSTSQSKEVFQIEVKDDNPIWFYCPQARHCQSSMVGVVNQEFDTGKTLDVFRSAAARVQGLSGMQAAVQGGVRRENPNPLGGF
jgi:plastocyanin